jgi:hypothetical protein
VRIRLSEKILRTRVDLPNSVVQNWWPEKALLVKRKFHNSKERILSELGGKEVGMPGCWILEVASGHLRRYSEFGIGGNLLSRPVTEKNRVKDEESNI